MKPHEKLTVLADFLENTIKPALDGIKWNMATWGELTVGDIDGLGYREYSDVVPDEVPKGDFDEALPKLRACGYAACAAGWARYCPQFVELGIQDDERINSLIVAAFFGIYLDDAIHIFSGDYQIPGTKDDYEILEDVPIEAVIERIRETAEKYKHREMT